MKFDIRMRQIIFIFVCSTLCAFSANGKDSDKPWTAAQFCVHDIDGTAGVGASVPSRFQLKTRDAKKLCTDVQSGVTSCFRQFSWVDAVPSDAQKKQLLSLCIHAQPEVGACIREGADSAAFSKQTFQSMDSVIQAFQSCTAAPAGFDKCYVQNVNNDSDMKAAWNKICPDNDPRIDCLSGALTNAMAAENASIPEVPKNIFKSCMSNPNFLNIQPGSEQKSSQKIGHTD